MKTILFHGPSGSGKDTQVDLLVQKYEFESIGTGEMFRTMYKEGDIESIKAYKYWSKGKLVPNNLVYSMLNRWIKRFDTTKSWAFVSVVRDVGQIPLFDDLLAKNNRTLNAFVHFLLSEEAAIERMSLRKICPNCDTTYHEKYKPEKIKIRLKEYNETIGPIVETYKNRGILIEIDASPTIEEIHTQLVQKLGL